MEKFTLYLGLNDKDTKEQKIDIIHAYKMCINTLTQYVEGATISNAKGIYKHKDGTIIEENTFKIELLFTTNTTIEKIVKNLKRKFNQETIAIQREVIDSVLM